MLTIKEAHETYMATGQDFPQSGDAKLRMEYRLLKNRMDEAAQEAGYFETIEEKRRRLEIKLELNSLYGKYADSDSIQEPPC